MEAPRFFAPYLYHTHIKGSPRTGCCLHIPAELLQARCMLKACHPIWESTIYCHACEMNNAVKNGMTPESCKNREYLAPLYREVAAHIQDHPIEKIDIPEIFDLFELRRIHKHWIEFEFELQLKELQSNANLAEIQLKEARAANYAASEAVLQLKECKEDVKQSLEMIKRVQEFGEFK